MNMDKTQCMQKKQINTNKNTDRYKKHMKISKFCTENCRDCNKTQTQTNKQTHRYNKHTHKHKQTNTKQMRNLIRF